MHLFVCVKHACRYQQRTGEGFISPGTGATEVCELPDVGAGDWIWGTLKEQQMLIMEPSSQSPVSYLIRFIVQHILLSFMASWTLYRIYKLNLTPMGHQPQAHLSSQVSLWFLYFRLGKGSQDKLQFLHFDSLPISSTSLVPSDFVPGPPKVILQSPAATFPIATTLGMFFHLSLPISLPPHDLPLLFPLLLLPDPSVLLPVSYLSLYSEPC